MAGQAPTPEKPALSQRLTPLERSIRPWRRAETLTRCFLYWIPVSGFPIPAQQREWLLLFFERLGEHLAKQRQLRAEVFLQIKVIYPDLLDTFLKHSFDLCPYQGLMRTPGGPLPEPVTMEDIRPIQEGRKKFDLKDYVGDYCFWFLEKNGRLQRELFLGHGGMTTIYLPPDPKTQAPKVPINAKIRKHPFFQQFDVDRIHARGYAMCDAFQPKSKELFGKGLEDKPEFRGIMFIVPLLAASDFINRPDAECASWFQLFDVYVNESPDDKGLILASKHDLGDFLAEHAEQMREKEQVYPV